MRLHISQTSLLLNEYLLINLSLLMATASAMSLIPGIEMSTFTVNVGPKRDR